MLFQYFFNEKRLVTSLGTRTFKTNKLVTNSFALSISSKISGRFWEILKYLYTYIK